MKHCWNLKEIDVIGLNENDFYSFVCDFPSIAETWILHHGSECMIQKIMIESTHSEICFIE